jgi:hypothetical protein
MSVNGDRWSGPTLFLVGLALFVLGFLVYGRTENPTTNEVIAAAGGAGGLFMMIAGVDRWRRERQMAHREPPEVVGARRQRHEELTALSAWTGIKPARSTAS